MGGLLLGTMQGHPGQKAAVRLASVLEICGQSRGLTQRTGSALRLALRACAGRVAGLAVTPIATSAA